MHGCTRIYGTKPASLSDCQQRKLAELMVNYGAEEARLPEKANWLDSRRGARSGLSGATTVSIHNCGGGVLRVPLPALEITLGDCCVPSRSIHHRGRACDLARASHSLDGEVAWVRMGHGAFHRDRPDREW